MDPARARRVDQLQGHPARKNDIPRIDVIIPAYNSAAYIEQAVASALTQRDVEVKVFVVDDGSTDDTAAVVTALADARIRLITGCSFRNVSRARNIGTALGSAPWISFLDADDLWPQNRTATLLTAITDPERQIAYGHMLTFTDGATLDPTAEQPPAGWPIGPAAGAVLFSRAVYQRVGELDETLRMGEFVDWMARARSLGVVDVPVSVIALLRRAHADNTTRDLPARTRDYLRVVAAHIARQTGSD